MRNNYFWGMVLGAVLALSLSGCGIKADGAINVPETELQAEAPAHQESTVVEKITGEIESMEESRAEPEPPVRMFGSVMRTENQELAIDNHSSVGVQGQILLSIDPDAAYILDSMTGLEMDEEDIQDGESVYVYAEETMTLSTPPKVQAKVIFAGLAEDAKAPDYTEIRSMVTDAASSQSVLTTSDETAYTLSGDCSIFPYGTKNRLTLDDLTEGKKCVVWSDDSHVAFKIMVFE